MKRGFEASDLPRLISGVGVTNLLVMLLCGIPILIKRRAFLGTMLR